MSPPAFSDLGKNAKDIFNKGYNFGYWSLDVKSRTNNGVEFNTQGSSDQSKGTVSGSLETKYKVKEYGLTFSEKWTTQNKLQSEVAIENQLVNGLKLVLSGGFDPQSGKKDGKFKSSYSHERVRLDGEVSLIPNGVSASSSAVVGYQGWLAGYSIAYDSVKAIIKENKFALGYTTGDFVLHSGVTCADDACKYQANIYQRCNDRLETGVELEWKKGESATKFGIAAKYALDKDAAVRAKVDNASSIGLGYQQKLRDGITLILSTNIDAKSFSAGGHKVGLGLELEA